MKCDCGHYKNQHLHDGDEWCCLEPGCKCAVFEPSYPIRLRNPRGIVVTVENLYDFVRRNPHMFEPRDIEPKHCPEHVGRRATEHWTNADRSLRAVILGTVDAWKGWCLATDPVDIRLPACHV